MKVCRVVVVTVLASGFGLLAGTVPAGPLDRAPMEQRYNPAAENMLRVPGVVGMYEQEARDVLQQTGLAVDVRYVRKEKKYAGKEGTVVEQVPSVGGVAMLGSSVTITVYRPPGFEGGITDESEYGNENGEYGGDEWYPDTGQEVWDEDTGDEGAPGWGSGSPSGGWTPQPNPLPAPDLTPGGSPGLPAGGLGLPGQAHPSGGTGGKREELLTPERARDLREKVDETLNDGVGPGSIRPGEGTGSGKTGAERPVPMSPDIEAVVPGGAKLPTPGQVGRALGAKEKAAGAGAPSVSPVPSMPSAGGSGKATVIEAVPVTPALTLQGGGGSAAPKGSAGGDTGTAPTFQAVPVTPTLTMQGGRAATSTPGVTDDGSCRSWTAIAADIYREADRVAQELKCAAVPGERLWKACIKYAKGPRWTQNLLKRWNNMVKRTSWATIGPRQLTFDKTHKGRLLSTGGRVFITPLPVDKDNVTLTLTKKAGKARTSVTVCSYTDGGDRVKMWDFVIPKGKKNKGQVWTKTFNGVEDRLISIHLDSKSGEHTFKYELKATKR